MSKYGVFSGPYFPVLGLKTRKYGPEKTPHLYVSHVVITSKPHLPLSLAWPNLTTHSKLTTTYDLFLFVA